LRSAETSHDGITSAWIWRLSMAVALFEAGGDIANITMLYRLATVQVEPAFCAGAGIGREARMSLDAEYGCI